ncbi:MAG: glycosyltransferase family 2 protein [Minisyncoccales bacterium]
MKVIQLSVIVPTYNREKDLEECLSSILNQTFQPNEIIIVDNSNNNETEKMIETKKEIFKKRGIPIKYIKNPRENSLTLARNIGVKNSFGEIILFLDDDVILNKNYIEEILKIYKKYPDALGVQGYILRRNISKIKNFINRIFYFSYYKKNICRILPSMEAIHPSSLSTVINCEWLSGANHSFKREVYEKFNYNYDENLKKYSEGEDLDFSYRIFKKFPNRLYITPHSKLVHKESQAGRILGKELIYMKEVYGLYLFYKIIDQNIKNKLIYLWSRVGKLIFNIGSSFFKLSPVELIKNIYLIRAYIYCLKHIKEIKNGELDFFNKTLK